MCLNYIHTPRMLLNSLETPKDFPPNFLSCAAHMHTVHCPSAGIRTFYIPQKCDTPSLSNCHLPTVTQLEVGSWEPLLHLCWNVLLSWFCIDFVQVTTDAVNSCVQQPVITLWHNFTLLLLVLQLLISSHPYWEMLPGPWLEEQWCMFYR